MDRRRFIQSTAAISAAAPAVQAAATSVRAEAEPVSVSDLTERLNPVIQQNREVALNILKPTTRQLEQGLRLHAESIVFDSYGFSPRAAVDGEAIAAAANDGASEIELKDMKEEMSMTRYLTDQVEQQEYRNAWRASGVTCIFQNAGEEGQDPLRLIKRLARFTYATDILKDFVFKASVPDDVLTAKREGRRCLYMTGNGVPLTQDWISVEDELRYLRIFYQLGIRMMHLTYQRRNMIGDGCGEASDAGLSEFGRKVIGEMNRVGVIPDCAHSGWRTSLEAAQVSNKPVVASHSTAASVYEHFRSKPDNVIRSIVDTGGYLGVCCIPRYLGGSGDIAALLDHIDYLVKHYGADYVAIGTDVSYTSQFAAAENKKIPRSAKRREEFRMLWPKDSFKTTREMTSSVAWTNWPLFTVGLIQRGHSEETIRKIIGGNVMRVAQQTMNPG